MHLGPLALLLLLLLLLPAASNAPGAAHVYVCMLGYALFSNKTNKRGGKRQEARGKGTLRCTYASSVSVPLAERSLPNQGMTDSTSITYASARATGGWLAAASSVPSSTCLTANVVGWGVGQIARGVRKDA